MTKRLARQSPSRGPSGEATAWRFVLFGSLVAVAAGLGGVALWPRPEQQDFTERTVSSLPLQRPVGAAAIENDDAFVQSILARPLFEATRRPPSIAAAIHPTDDSPALPRLSGTIIGADGYRAAVLVPVDADRSITVREGDRIGDLLIVQISLGAVPAENARQRFELKVAHDHNVAIVRPPVAPSGAITPIPVAGGDVVSAKDPRERSITDQDE